MPASMFDPNEYAPSCAVCGEPAEGECSSNCESHRLHMAIDRAEAVWLDRWQEKTREWVANNSVRYITSAFSALKEARLDSYRAYIRALPYFNLYEQYGGRPPLHPHYVANLHRQIREAEFDLRRNIDNDWRSCVIRYPEVLAFFYSQVNINTPKQPEMPTALAGSIPKFTIPLRPMSAVPATRSSSGASGNFATAAQKKQRRKSVTTTFSGKDPTGMNEEEAMAILNKMLKEQKEPYPRPKTNGGGPDVNMSHASNKSAARFDKRMYTDYATMGMGGGIPRAPMPPMLPMNQPYRPDGGRFA